MKINIKHPERVFNKHIYDILYNYDTPTGFITAAVLRANLTEWYRK